MKNAASGQLCPVNQANDWTDVLEIYISNLIRVVSLFRIYDSMLNVLFNIIFSGIYLLYDKVHTTIKLELKFNFNIL